MRAYGNSVGLVGISTFGAPKGQWIKDTIDNTEFDAFYFGHAEMSYTRPLVPARISRYMQLRRYKNQIMSLGVNNVLIQAPELLMACYDWGWNSICFRFPGVVNPLESPRYSWGKYLRQIYNIKMYAALRHVDVVLASADEHSIDNLVSASKGKIDRQKLVKFPTRVNTNIFRPIDRDTSLSHLNINKEGPIIVCNGRINKVKGWELVISAFAMFLESHKSAHLYFVGDGEDRGLLEREIASLGINDNVTITGYQSQKNVNYFYNISDLVVVGSFREGWSVAMCEAISCGKRIVSTDVSGAKDMIQVGKNGYIVEGREESQFTDAMESALLLNDYEHVSLDLAKQYSEESLVDDINGVWTHKTPY
jgi:glycosyltransferase involved in cell wall biosynthesis